MVAFTTTSCCSLTAACNPIFNVEVGDSFDRTTVSFFGTNVAYFVVIVYVPNWRPFTLYFPSKSVIVILVTPFPSTVILTPGKVSFVDSSLIKPLTSPCCANNATDNKLNNRNKTFLRIIISILRHKSLSYILV